MNDADAFEIARRARLAQLAEDAQHELSLILWHSHWKVDSLRELINTVKELTR